MEIRGIYSDGKQIIKKFWLALQIPSIYKDSSRRRRVSPHGFGDAKFPKSPMNSELLPGTLDWYREKGKTDEDIAALVGLIDRMQVQLVKALERVVELQPKNRP